MKNVSRRAMLRGVGGAAVGLPLLDAMLGGQLEGTACAQAARPRRVIFFMTGQGFMMDHWRPGNAQDPTSSRILKPLAFVKDRILTITGVPQSSTQDPGNRAQGHPGGTAGCLTGNFAGMGNQYSGQPNDYSAGFPDSESIDSAIGRHLQQTKAPVRYPVFHLGAKVMDNALSRRFFYAGPGQPVTPNENPYSVYDQFFKDFNPGPPTSTVDVTIKNRRSVLNAVMADFQSLRCKLGVADRSKLTAHLDRISDLEKLLGVDTVVTGTACKKAVAPTSGINWSSWDDLPRTVAAQTAMASMMVACDRARVIGMQVGAPDSQGGYFPFIGINEDQHALSHQANDPGAVEKMVKIQEWMANRIADLVRSLQSIDEGGSSAFDNTTILWGAEVGNPWSHDRIGMAWTLIGNGGGYFKTGRHINFSGTRTHAHNRLLLHFLRMMGSSAAQFGDSNYSGGGPLENLT